MQIICKRCLIEDDAGQRPLNALIKEYLAAIPPEDKVPDAEYRRRLRMCQACDNLNGGMCGMCGCYVEVRAIRAVRHCPDIDRKW